MSPSPPRQAVDKPHGFVVDWSGGFPVFLGVSQALTISENSIVPDEKPSTTLPGIVEKLIKPRHPRDPEKAQIVLEGADHLYREIRIVNTLNDANGQELGLKPGAPPILLERH